MKNLILSFAILLCFILGMSQAQAQQLQLISKNESAAQSTYVLQVKYIKIQLQLKKVGMNQVQMDGWNE